MVVVVGERGSGKSTLAKLIQRMYLPESGRVLVDGVDLRELDLDGWRRQLGVVFQDFMRYSLVALPETPITGSEELLTGRTSMTGTFKSGSTWTPSTVRKAPGAISWSLLFRAT